METQRVLSSQSRQKYKKILAFFHRLLSHVTSISWSDFPQISHISTISTKRNYNLKIFPLELIRREKTPLCGGTKYSVPPVVAAAVAALTLEETEAAADSSKAKSVCMEADAVEGIAAEEFGDQLWIEDFRRTWDMFN